MISAGSGAIALLVAVLAWGSTFVPTKAPRMAGLEIDVLVDAPASIS